jgi:hypothetical protein
MQSSGPASEAAGSPPSTVWPEPIGHVPIFSALELSAQLAAQRLPAQAGGA